jgi:hypothetical protein
MLDETGRVHGLQDGIHLVVNIPRGDVQQCASAGGGAGWRLVRSEKRQKLEQKKSNGPLAVSVCAHIKNSSFRLNVTKSSYLSRTLVLKLSSGGTNSGFQKHSIFFFSFPLGGRDVIDSPPWARHHWIGQSANSQPLVDTTLL